MKILHIAIAYEPASAYGGPIKSIRNLCSGLNSLGHSTTVCVTNSDGTRNTDVKCNIPNTVNGIEVFYFDSPRLQYYGYSPSMKKWLKKNIGYYDIVQIHGIYSFPQQYAAKLARKNKIPYIITPRGSADKRLVVEYLRLAKWIYLHIYDRRNFKKVTAFHYTTNAEADYSVLKFTKRPYFIVPNAVNFEELKRYIKPDTNSHEKQYFLFVGRITWKKQVDVLIKSFAQINKRDNSYELLIVGPDNENRIPKLTQLAKNENVLEKVKFLGMLEGKKLFSIYKNALIYILPSLSENFGHTVVEAMFMGTPVLASNCVDVTTIPEIKKLVTNCKANTDSVTKELNNILINYKTIKKQALKTTNIVEELFGIESTANKMSQHYNSIRIEN